MGWHSSQKEDIGCSEWQVGPFTANRFSLYYIGQSSMNSAVPSKPISASKSLTVLTLDFFQSIVRPLVYELHISLFSMIQASASDK